MFKFFKIVLQYGIILVLIANDIFGTSYCPLRFPYAYNGGRHCCKYNLEKPTYQYLGSYTDEYCNGSALSLESKCCFDDLYRSCPSGASCVSATFENDPCSSTHPYPYYFGLYCCKTKKEKTAFEKRSVGTTCQNNVLSLTSECCEGDEFIKCVNPPCVEMEFWSLTWIAEGNDNPNDAAFSRRLRLTDTDPKSAVLGKGYYMTNLLPAFIVIELNAIGLPSANATALSQGGFKFGAQAVTVVNNNQDNILTHKQQLDLFKSVRDTAIESIKGILASLTPKVEDFDTKHYSIKGLLLDLQITKQYVGPVLTAIHQFVVDNNVQGLASYVSDQANWPQVSQERFNVRKNYMETAVNSL